MNRRCFRPLTAVFFLILFFSVAANAQQPNYTITLPGNNKLYVGVRSAANLDGGGQTVRVANRVGHDPKSVLTLDATLTTDAENVPQNCRVRWGGADDPVAGAPILLDLLATNQKNGSYEVHHPVKSGTLTAGAGIVSTLDALLFLGRRYDFKRGGAQTFALLVDFGTDDTTLVTLTLEAVGKEMLTLADGTFPVRKMRFEAPLSFVPEAGRKGFFYIGAHGEMLKCESPLLGFPLTAQGPAAITNNGKTVALHFFGANGLVLRADKSTLGWDISFKVGRDYKFSGETTDLAYAPLHVTNPFRGRPYEATISHGEVRYTLSGTPPEPTEVPMGRVWFVVDWFATDRWEQSGGMFALAVSEQRDGVYFPMFTGQTTGGAFSLTRLPDFGTAHHYRFVSKGTTNYELYTDGSRLLHLAGTDGTTITRDGWEKWASGLKPPVAPKP